MSNVPPPPSAPDDGSNGPTPPSAPDSGSSVPPVTPPPASPPPAPPASTPPPSASTPPQPAYTPQPGYGTQQGSPQQTGYAPQAGPNAYGGGGYTPVPSGSKTNVLAIISLCASGAGLLFLYILGPIAGIIMGHIALGQIKRTGEQGRGLALGGTIGGYVVLGLQIIGFAALIIIPLIIAAGASSYSDY